MGSCLKMDSGETSRSTRSDQSDCFAVVGTIVHATFQNPMLILSNKVIGINKRRIVFIEDEGQLEYVVAQWKISDRNIYKLSDSQFLMPGLVDTHIHASQYVYAGTALDVPLMEWLARYTFPTEASYKDPTFAEHAYRKAVRRVLKNGTTTACYFATIHHDATLKLCQIIDEYGQRALVGKVNMDCNSPDNYVEDTQQSLADTESFVQAVLSKKESNVTPVVTPRFAVTCSRELMVALAKIAKQYNIPIQSHLSESAGEILKVQELYPECRHYTDIYDKYGLLTSQTVMAHCIHLSDDEMQIIKARGTGVAHCPNSNTSLRSGMMDARKLMDKGVKLGLATDVSGGYHPSMLDAMRQAVQVSNMLSLQRTNGYRPLDYKDVFRLATLGGSQVLGLEDTIGNFSVGKDFDALIVDLKAPGSPFDIFERDTLEDCIQKFVFLGDDRNIMDVYVAGRKIKLS